LRLLLGTAHFSTAQSLNNLARLDQAQGRHAEAESMYALRLVTPKQATPTFTSTSLDNLTGLYENQGKSWEVKPQYEQPRPDYLSKE
jgi:hypothetical protein